MEFNNCKEPTVGVEWELQLVDVETLNLFDGILPLIEFFPDTEFVKPEYIQSCVELTSCVAETSDMAVEHIRRSLKQILQRCRELGMSVIGAGTHPFCRRLALITPTSRYTQIEKNYGYMAHSQIAFGTHVHIGMRSGDEMMRAMSRLTPALPTFIALSANSPFWRSHKTGHAAYRHRILAALPSFGFPVEFHDWADFERFYNVALKSGMIRQIKDIHWDIRPHPDFGTVEIRAMDAAPDLQTLHALTVFARVMAVCMVRALPQEVSRVIPIELPAWIQRENCYRASHCGLNASFIYNENGDYKPLSGLISDLIDFCEPVAHDIGESKNLGFVRQILTDGPGHLHQLEAYAEHRSTYAVAAYLKRQLLKEDP